MIRHGNLMIIVSVLLSACGQLTIETTTPTERVVITPTAEDPPPTSALSRTLAPFSPPTPFPSLTPSPSPLPSPTPSPVTTMIPADPNAAHDDWTYFTYEKANKFRQGFVLHYPKSWALTIVIEDYGYGEVSMRLSLEKLGFKINIGQFAPEGTSCLYPEDPELEGWYSRYGEYVEIEKENGVVWRRARAESGLSESIIYRVCEFEPGREYAVALMDVGLINMESPNLNGSILSEFDEILRRIELLD